MSNLNSYQESLDQYQNIDQRQESDEELERMIQESAPIPEQAPNPAPRVTRDAEGDLQMDTAPVEQAAPEAPAEPEVEMETPEENKERNLNLFQQATEWVATEVLGQDPEERAQVKEEYQQRAEDMGNRIENAGGLEGFTRDAVRVIPSGIDKAAQDAIGFANFAGDFAKTKLGMVEEDDVWNNTDHKDYKGSERDLVLAEPRSTAGQFARDMVSFVTMANKVKAVTGLGKAGAAAQTMGGVQGFASRVGIETAAGAVADFIMDPGDGNASNALIEIFPSLADNEILAAFAHDDDDDEFSRRVKNLAEGGVMGNAVDAVGTAFKGLFRASKPLREWALQNPGKKPSQAPQEIKELAVDELYKAFEEDDIYHGTHNAEAIEASGFRPSRGESDTLGRGVYFTSDPKLASAYGPQTLGGRVDKLNIKELTYEEVQEVFEVTGGMNDLGGPVDVDALRKAFGDEFDAVRVKGLYDRDADIDEVLIFDPQKADSLIKKEEFTPGQRPGYQSRIAESYTDGGTKSQPDYEPYERAGKTAEFPISKVIDEQEYNASAPRFTPGAPSPRLTDNTVRQIGEGGGDLDVIQKAVKELEDELTPALRSKDPAVLQEAREKIAKYYLDNEGEKIDMSALTDMVDDDGLPSAFIRTVLGNKVAKTLMRDASQQLSDLSQQVRQITDTGMDGNRQYNLMFDRLKALSVLQIKDGSRRGVGLQALKPGFGGSSETAVKKRIDDFAEKVEGLRKKVNEGDPEAMQDLKVFADSLVFADGDPDMAMDFTEKFLKYGRENFETTMYNSYLSGLVTQERNILGNSTNIFLKPLEMAMGSLGNPKGARAAASMYVSMFDSFKEGFRVAATSLTKNTPDSISKMERNISRGDMMKKITNLRASAKTPGEHAAGMLLQAQYTMMANPLLQGATRMLEAADKGFRVVSARQKAKFDMVYMSMEDGIAFDPKKFELNLKTKIKDGEVVDEQLLQWAKKDTFQEDLGVQMSQFADLVNNFPFLKYVIPFVKTPTNIIKQTGNYVPLLGRLATSNPVTAKFFKEYTAVMKGDDEVAKAIYRGREGMGLMVGVSFMSMGFQGLSTGAGPRDPQLRAIWEAK